MRLLLGLSLIFAAFLVGGCDSAVTRPQLYEHARQLRTATPQGQMLHVGSDDKFDYYRFEPGGQRFKVPRNSASAVAPASQIYGACGKPGRGSRLI